MEEQDDTILWLLAAMQSVNGNKRKPLEWIEMTPTFIENRKIPVYVVEEDLAERGLAAMNWCRALSSSHAGPCRDSLPNTRSSRIPSK